VESLGIVNLRYCGYVAVAKVNNIEKAKVNTSIKPIDITDQPEGGAHALNINRSIALPFCCSSNILEIYTAASSISFWVMRSYSLF
jgi:hypothetical protein